MSSPELMRREAVLERVFADLGTEEALRRREAELFDSLAMDAKTAVIVGCGSLGQILLAGTRSMSIPVVAFVDNNRALHGHTIDGIPVLSPVEAVARYRETAFFLVGIYNSEAPRRQLRNLGAARIVPYPAFYWRFAASIERAPGLELPHRVRRRSDEVRAAYGHLADDRSRLEFAAQIGWRCSLNYALLTAPDAAEDIYFPTDLFHLTGSEVFVDCGAFDGDSIRLFRARTGATYRQIYACEPDPTNRESLERYLATLSDTERQRISVLPFAVGSHSGLVSFEITGTAGSRMTQEVGSQSIECRRLDDLFNVVPPTIIKMDIEGAEPQALVGAATSIRSARPILSVCAYHHCEHLWTLPTLLKSILPDYQLFLRRYAEECWEMVYYAVPPERLIKQM